MTALASMEDVAFSEWPGQPVDLSGSNPWLPAYGFQNPGAIQLDKDDFLGNPGGSNEKNQEPSNPVFFDAALFLHGSAGQHFVYLETILEETSDDLRSESDRSGSRASPVGWLATDSESGSVIRVDMLALDEIDSGSESEMACPAKRRRQDPTLLTVTAFSDDESSLSRSSSLLQFENLEKQCQEFCSSSPSVFSSFSYDSLEHQRKLSPDSLEQADSDSESESSYYKALKIDVPNYSRRYKNKDSLFYNTTSSLSDTDSKSDSESGESEKTLQASMQNLKACRSFDCLSSGGNTTNSLPVCKKAAKDKISAENLSEDSGYSDHFCNYMKRSSSIPNIQIQSIPFVEKITMKYDSSIKKTKKRKINADHLQRQTDGFDAYDGEVAFPSFASNFGSSYQDLTLFNKYDLNREHRSPLIDRFMRNGAAKRRAANFEWLKDQRTDVLNLGTGASECAKFNSVVASTSEPNLVHPASSASSTSVDRVSANRRNPEEVCCDEDNNYFGSSSAYVSSVPKDLNLLAAGDADQQQNQDVWKLNFAGSKQTDRRSQTSIAAKNWDLGRLEFTDDFDEAPADIHKSYNMATSFTRIRLHKQSPPSLSSNSDVDTPSSSFLREGSYIEAMSNLVDMSDDERSLSYKDMMPTSKTLNFDSKMLKAISETSVKSFGDAENLDMYFTSTPINQQQKRNVLSTPNLSVYHQNEEDMLSSIQDSSSSTENLPKKKSSLVNRSTSINGVSEADDKTLTSAKSYSGSTNSKGVHFCPVVSEVNWRDDSSHSSLEQGSSYSLSSSTPTPDRELPPLRRPEARRPQQIAPPRMSSSQPALDNKEESPPTEYTFIPLNPQKLAVSSPELALRRRQCYGSVRDDEAVDVYFDEGQQCVRSSAAAPTTGAAAKVEEKRKVEAAKQAVAAMESTVQRRPPVKPARASKLGGFLSRFASFRFSTRKSSGSDDSKKKKDKAAKQQDADAKKKDKDTLLLNNANKQPVATKEDYIYIPLKGPSVSAPSSVPSAVTVTDEGKGCVSGKPPLPKMPPRIVGASVKKRPEGASARSGVATGCRNIDSGDAVPRNAASMEPMGLIETDLDTEVTVITSGAHVKTRSLMNLGAEAPPRRLATAPLPARPHKSMEFLLDKENLKVVEPPENELQKGTGERVMSEHQLRVQRSLQKLTVPEWYKPSQVPREGFLLKKHKPRDSYWTTTTSKTPSLSSLGSGHSSLLLSPTPHSQSFVRWSTSKLNSTASSPCASTRSSFNSRQANGTISPSSVRSSFSYRQPYMGWRSQERLSRPRTPAERLATSLLSHQQQEHQNQHQQHQQPEENPEIQTSIKEVTSAIVHYVSGLRPEPQSLSPHPDRGYESQDTASQRSRSASPRGSQKLCWLESSFVGTRPLDTPQTPVTLAESQPSTSGAGTSSGAYTGTTAAAALRLDLHTVHNDPERSETSSRPSPGSATMDDVLGSLLALPPSTRAPSPCLQETASASSSPSKMNKGSDQFRRRSEGSEPATRTPQEQTRRLSFHASEPVVRCRYSQCGKVAVASSSEGRAYKNCHNCSYTYCSRLCRRAHWEKHRKTCLFSRVGALCRQVLAGAKEKSDTLHHLSLIARRGYLSVGPGAVKCFFPCPEAAEKFVDGDLADLGEPVYVPWPDLLPSEMGPHLYAELVKTCKAYNPDSRLVLYVAVCVVSEAPAAGAVKWERQLVSRCAKMRLSKALIESEANGDDQDFLLLGRLSASEDAAVREESFVTIQRRLRQRGVSLRRQFPDVYTKIVAYLADGAARFNPVTFYPVDSSTGKNFTCVILREESTAPIAHSEHD